LTELEPIKKLEILLTVLHKHFGKSFESILHVDLKDKSKPTDEIVKCYSKMDWRLLKGIIRTSIELGNGGIIKTYIVEFHLWDENYDRDYTDPEFDAIKIISFPIQPNLHKVKLRYYITNIDIGIESQELCIEIGNFSTQEFITLSLNKSEIPGKVIDEIEKHFKIPRFNQQEHYTAPEWSFLKKLKLKKQIIVRLTKQPDEQINIEELIGEDMLELLSEIIEGLKAGKDMEAKEEAFWHILDERLPFKIKQQIIDEIFKK